MTQLTWLITGCSSGFGEELILSVLARGDRAIATTRGSTDRIKHLKDAGAATMSLDVTDSQAELDAKIQEALKIYNGIDVLINNAGYIEAGLVEDVTHERLVASCNTNLFGPINLTRSILPHFRQRKAGTIIFMGSVGGWQGEVGAGPYCVGKFGLEECLQKETSQFGIRTVIIEPGYYRTKVYSEANYEPTQTALEGMVKAVDGNQPGDTKKAADRIVDIVRREGLAAGKETPLRLPLGPDCLQQIKDKCLSTLKILEDWEELIVSTKLDGK
ncbi:uncharacterized protein EAE97_007635 [Botrytis byssoidea]|uniref:Uncharacterized protein n=1 Tax=Botrytis byssoidea TaxID=139641 RepID=A0A9P5ILR2_9HELO|nr:uncharacterized protein EAE97_007635 [Botrytis byssoidea]KAF7937839.1 hypothetical protein EAE97_007635 [Botrytis byssoidea]